MKDARINYYIKLEKRKWKEKLRKLKMKMNKNKLKWNNEKKLLLNRINRLKEANK